MKRIPVLALCALLIGVFAYAEEIELGTPFATISMTESADAECTYAISDEAVVQLSGDELDDSGVHAFRFEALEDGEAIIDMTAGEETATYFAKVEGGVFTAFELKDCKAIVLESNPTTGYSWLATSSDESIALIKGPIYTQDEAPEGKVGVGGEEKFFIIAVAPGTAEITFDYERSWEDGEPIDTTSFMVTVNEDLTIEIAD